MKTRITYSAICFLALLAATPQQQLVIQPVHSILLLREQSIKLWYNYQVNAAEIGDYKYDIAEHPMGVITTIKIKI
jgi:hypothetical protein